MGSGEGYTLEFKQEAVGLVEGFAGRGIGRSVGNVVGRSWGESGCGGVWIGRDSEL